MKSFREVLPAAGLGSFLIVLITLQLLGLDSIGSWAQTTFGAISLIVGILILGLCIVAPLAWAVHALIKILGKKH